jgi:hypothetical protein
MTATSPLPPVASPGAGTASLYENDRRIAGYVRLERTRFALLGGWVVSTAELEVKQALERHAHHHAWHASLWEQHLPRRSGYEAPAGGHGGGDLDACLASLAAEELPDTVERLAGAYRVVAARAVATYAEHLSTTSVVSDPAVARTCRLVLADQLDDWREGEALLQSLLDSDDRIDRAAHRQAGLEKLSQKHLAAEP